MAQLERAERKPTPPSAKPRGPVTLAYEVARPYVITATYCVAAAYGLWWVALPAAALIYVAAFVQLHDTMHSSAGLPRKLNDALMTLSALLLFKSGHGVRASHLQHHALELRDGDLEGTPAHWSLLRVVLTGPWYAVKLRFLVFGLVKPRIRRIMIAENLTNALQVALCFYFGVVRGNDALALYWLFVVALTCAMPLWASWIPHHIPERHPLIVRLKGLGREWTPALNSYLFHERHHEFPKMPARDLYQKTGTDETDS